ncbi:MAG: hypothetical protein RBS49_07420 [Sphaerochaeta sp.]|nr:hypothetical protein [Sphaerochaeta sp.]
MAACFEQRPPSRWIIDVGIMRTVVPQVREVTLQDLSLKQAMTVR